MQPCPRHPGYKTNYGGQHRRWALEVKQRANGYCQAKGCMALGNEADHITAILDGGAQYDVRNGQWLCKHHHSTKTMTLDGGAR